MGDGLMRKAVIVFFFLVQFVVANAAGAAAPTGESLRIQRLIYLCKLWGTVRYLHPYLFYKDIDWDTALVAAIPKVSAAKTTDEYATALRDLLAVLHDPVTQIAPEELDEQSQTRPHTTEQPKITEWLEPHTLAIYLNRLSAGSFNYTAVQPVKGMLREAQAVIIDLRASSEETDRWMGYMFENMRDLLPFRQVRAPALRNVVHSGYHAQPGGIAGHYYSYFAVGLQETFEAPPNAKAKRVAIVVNGRSTIPSVALALQVAGDGFLVSEGAPNEEGLADCKTVTLGEGLEAKVRRKEFADGYQLHADVQLPARTQRDSVDLAIKAAMATLKHPPRPKKPHGASTPAGIWRADKPYAEMQYPSLEYRLLALFRFWNVIENFYPYKHLIQKEWKGVLDELIPKMEAAHDADQYQLALLELAAHVPDGHTNVLSSRFSSYVGAAPPPLAVNMVEGKVTITRIAAPNDAPGVSVGDVVLSVDGEPVEARLQRYARYRAASTAAAQTWILCGILLNGADGSTAVLKIRDATGSIKEVKLARKREFARPLAPPPPGGEAVRILDGSIGYVNLPRLGLEAVDSMFEQLKQTRALIFDMRGYPQGTAWKIAPRINTRGAHYGAMFQRALVGENGVEEERFAFMQSLAESNQWKYRGKTVMLIDERTISQAEHSGLFFEAANGTKFIGSHSAGANGDVTRMVLPGGIAVTFGAHDVRHADGRQLQRVGLVPDIEVHPTLAGIRAGKDEVLERALEYLKKETAQPAKQRSEPAQPTTQPR